MCNNRIDEYLDSLVVSGKVVSYERLGDELHVYCPATDSSVTFHFPDGEKIEFDPKQVCFEAIFESPTFSEVKESLDLLM